MWGLQRKHTAGYTESWLWPEERHNGTKLKWVKLYWNVWILSLLSRPVTLTYDGTLKPVLLRQLNDKWSCLSANICYSSAAWTGTARPAGCMVLAWQPTLKPTSYSSVTQLQPFSNQTLLSELCQLKSHPILNVTVSQQPIFKELFIVSCLSWTNWSEKQSGNEWLCWAINNHVLKESN